MTERSLFAAAVINGQPPTHGARTGHRVTYAPADVVLHVNDRHVPRARTYPNVQSFQVRPETAA